MAAAPAAEVLERDGIYAVRTGIASNTENGVVGGAVPTSADAVRDVIAWFGERRLPASWLVPEGDGRAANAETLEAAGCRSERSAWELRAALEGLALEPAGGADARTVRGERDLEAWLDVASPCGWFETDHERGAW